MLCVEITDLAGVTQNRVKKRVPLVPSPSAEDLLFVVRKAQDTGPCTCTRAATRSTLHGDAIRTTGAAFLG